MQGKRVHWNSAERYDLIGAAALQVKENPSLAQNMESLILRVQRGILSKDRQRKKLKEPEIQYFHEVVQAQLGGVAAPIFIEQNLINIEAINTLLTRLTKLESDVRTIMQSGGTHTEDVKALLAWRNTVLGIDKKADGQPVYKIGYIGGPASLSGILAGSFAGRIAPAFIHPAPRYLAKLEVVMTESDAIIIFKDMPETGLKVINKMRKHVTASIFPVCCETTADAVKKTQFFLDDRLKNSGTD